MADITAVVAHKAYLATLSATQYYFVTLHDTGGSALTVNTTTYTAGIAGELATANGYTRGAKTATPGASTNNVTMTDPVWTASGGSIGPASYAALWVNTTNTITGATLVMVKDSSGSTQTATTGNTMTADFTNPITF